MSASLETLRAFVERRIDEARRVTNYTDRKLPLAFAYGAVLFAEAAGMVTTAEAAALDRQIEEARE